MFDKEPALYISGFSLYFLKAAGVSAIARIPNTGPTRNGPQQQSITIDNIPKVRIPPELGIATNVLIFDFGGLGGVVLLFVFSVPLLPVNPADCAVTGASKLFISVLVVVSFVSGC
jgi:hypothetical protein